MTFQIIRALFQSNSLSISILNFRKTKSCLNNSRHLRKRSENRFCNMLDTREIQRETCPPDRHFFANDFRKPFLCRICGPFTGHRERPETHIPLIINGMTQTEMFANDFRCNPETHQHKRQNATAQNRRTYRSALPCRRVQKKTASQLTPATP